MSERDVIEHRAGEIASQLAQVELLLLQRLDGPSRPDDNEIIARITAELERLRTELHAANALLDSHGDGHAAEGTPANGTSMTSWVAKLKVHAPTPTHLDGSLGSIRDGDSIGVAFVVDGEAEDHARKHAAGELYGPPKWLSMDLHPLEEWEISRRSE